MDRRRPAHAPIIQKGPPQPIKQRWKEWLLCQAAFLQSWQAREVPKMTCGWFQPQIASSAQSPFRRNEHPAA